MAIPERFRGRNQVSVSSSRVQAPAFLLKLLPPRFVSCYSVPQMRWNVIWYVQGVYNFQEE